MSTRVASAPWTPALLAGFCGTRLPEVSFYRPVPAANSICWLVWHSARIQDAQVAHGYGHTPAEVAKVRVPADVLAGYYHAVHQMMLAYIAGVTDEELARVVDENWSPPVTAAVRLVSIIDDCLQHLGQAAHIRGNAR